MPGPHGGALKIPGLCSFCETPTRIVCRLCGRGICADHATEDEDVCIECGNRNEGRG